jgi:hypothetical protein
MATLTTVFKRGLVTQKHGRRIQRFEQIPKVVTGVRFVGEISELVQSIPLGFGWTSVPWKTSSKFELCRSSTSFDYLRHECWKGFEHDREIEAEG